MTQQPSVFATVTFSMIACKTHCWKQTTSTIIHFFSNRNTVTSLYLLVLMHDNMRGQVITSIALRGDSEGLPDMLPGCKELKE